MAGGSVEEGSGMLETVFEWVIRGWVAGGVAEGCGRRESEEEAAKREVSVSGEELIRSTLERF